MIFHYLWSKHKVVNRDLTFGLYRSFVAGDPAFVNLLACNPIYVHFSSWKYNIFTFLTQQIIP